MEMVGYAYRYVRHGRHGRGTVRLEWECQSYTIMEFREFTLSFKRVLVFDTDQGALLIDKIFATEASARDAYLKYIKEAVDIE